MLWHNVLCEAHEKARHLALIGRRKDKATMKKEKTDISNERKHVGIMVQMSLVYLFVGGKSVMLSVPSLKCR